MCVIWDGNLATILIFVMQEGFGQLGIQEFGTVLYFQKVLNK